MLFRSLAAAAALLVASTPVAAQDLDLRAQVAAFVQPSNEARTAVVVAQLRAAGFEPTVETFTGGNARSGRMEGRADDAPTPSPGWWWWGARPHRSPRADWAVRAVADGPVRPRAVGAGHAPPPQRVWQF